MVELNESPEIPPDWRERTNEIMAPLLNRWEDARKADGTDLSPGQLCPEAPSEFQAALAEAIDCLKMFERKFTPKAPPGKDELAQLFHGGELEGRKHIDEGGQGSVILARDQQLKREVAVKRLKPQWAWMPDARRRLEQEARITGRLEHPGVIPVYCFGQDAEGEPYYAMRYVKHERTMLDVLNEVHQLEGSLRNVAFQKLLQDFVKVCQTINYAHDRNIIHRDLKPANIMVGEYGEVFVVDWGLAKSLSAAEPGSISSNPSPAVQVSTLSATIAQEMTKGAVGTLAYMSPEQTEDTSQLTPSSDIYSLGATLYHLLTGSAPVSGGSIAELLRKVREADFPSPRSRTPDLSPALNAICLKAMASQPEDRYPSARALANDLENYLADEPVTALPDPVSVRVRRWMKRHRTLVTTTAASLLVFLLAALISSGLLAKAYTAEAEASKQASDNAREARNLALDLKDALNNEREAREKAETAARVSEALRLASVVKDLDTRFPQLRALLAAEALERLGKDGSSAQRAVVQQAMRDALAGLNGTGLFPAHGDRVSCLAVSPDGRWLASGSRDHTLRVWDLKTDLVNHRPILQAHWAEIDQVRFTPDSSRLIAVGDGKRLYIWNMEQRELNAFRKEGALTTLSVEKSGHLTGSFGLTDRWLTVAVEKKSKTHLFLWDLQSAEIQKSKKELFGPLEPNSQLRRRVSAAISPDNRWLVAGGINWAWVFDLHSPDPEKSALLIHGMSGTFDRALFSPDGHWLALATFGQVYLLDFTTEAGRAKPLGLPFNRVRHIQFSPDSERLLVSGSREGGTIWDLTAPDIAASQVQLNYPPGFGELQLSADNRWLVAAYGYSDTSVLVWDQARQNQTAPPLQWSGHEGAVRQTVMTPDSRYLFTAGDDGTIRRFRLAPDGDLAAAVVLRHTSEARVHGVNQILINRQGNWLAAQQADKTIRLWNLQGKQPGDQSVLLNNISVDPVIQFSDNGRWLAGVSDNQVKLWDTTAADIAASEITFCHASQGTVRECSVGPTGEFVAAVLAENGEYRTLLWHRRDGVFLERPPTEKNADGVKPAKFRVLEKEPKKKTIREIAFSPDGRWLVTGGANEKSPVRLWDLGGDLQAPRLILPEPVEPGRFQFIPQRNWLIACQTLGPLVVWDLSDLDHPKQITRLEPSSHRFSVSQDGRWLADGESLWNLNEQETPLTSLEEPGENDEIYGSTLRLYGLSFSQDGRRLLGGSYLGPTFLWDLTGPKIPATRVLLNGYPDRFNRFSGNSDRLVNAMAFTPDNRFAVSNTQRSVWLFPLQPEELIRRARLTAGRQLMKEERQRYLFEE